MMFLKFSIHNIYVTMYGIFSELHFIVSLFLTRWDKVLKRMKTMGQIFYFFLGNFFRHGDIYVMYAKWLKHHFNESLFPNRGEKVMDSGSRSVTYACVLH